MRYEVILAPEAIDDLRGLRPHICSAVRDAMESHLRHEPTRISKTRIKRLRGLSRPQFRLRVEDVRIFCDMIENTVEVLGIVTKGGAEEWLRKAGKPNENRGTQ